MNRRYLIIAGVCGAVTIFLLIFYFSTFRPRQPKIRETVVVVAQVFIPDRKIVTADLLAVKKLPETQAAPGVFNETETLIGQVAVGDIKPGEQITAGRVAVPGKDFGLAFIIPPNLRAVTIALPESSGLRGLVLPGDKVDVLVTLEVGRTKETLTFTLLRNITILAVGQMLERPRGPLPRLGMASGQTESDLITLAVTPEDAEKISLAIRKASLHLTLRPITAESAAELYLPGISLQQLEDEGYLGALLEDRRSSAGPAAGEESRIIKTIRGTSVEEVIR